VSGVALVTGATSGIGRAAALALADAGWWVAAHGRDADRGAAVAGALGDRGTFLAADLNADGAPDRLVADATSAGGPLDLLVNNAAVHQLATVTELDPDDFDALMATNVRAPVLLARAAIRSMRGRGGTIVNVSSEAGLVAVPGQVAYNVSKAALIMLTRSIAVDHAVDGVRAVSVCPGTTRTALVDRAIASAPDPGAHEAALAESRPARRLGTPEEVAAAIVYAASPEASFMTGTELVIDGGYTAA
jgi:NAD(P)-dependent dehydrogenase (short-subunit alcohol dehydrogenase family)